jgi:hypothetical protein
MYGTQQPSTILTLASKHIFYVKEQKILLSMQTFWGTSRQKAKEPDWGIFINISDISSTTIFKIQNARF